MSKTEAQGDNEARDEQPFAQRLNEEQLKKQAEYRVTYSGPLPEKGKPLPKGFTNPEPGKVGHRCLDQSGLYQPSWYCLLLHEGEGMPTRQSFRCAGKPYSVRVGQWVDVPPEIIQVLQMAEVSVVKYDNATEDDLLAGPSRPRVVGTRPRFNYNVLASA